jgi:hypothetical protein
MPVNAVDAAVGSRIPQLDRPADLYLVLDSGEFTAYCRVCSWIGPPSTSVAGAKTWFAGHRCDQGDFPPRNPNLTHRLRQRLEGQRAVSR